jgi:hypothetical protein
MARTENGDNGTLPFGADALALLQAVYSHGGPDLDQIPVATHWPSLSAEDTLEQWTQLRAWVEQLQHRFEFLDHHVLPRCWFKHNGHVEALAALRDHERVSFSDTAPATAPLDWLRALRDTAFILRSWTADLPCGATHQATSLLPTRIEEDAWQRHITQDVAHRKPASES